MSSPVPQSEFFNPSKLQTAFDEGLRKPGAERKGQPQGKLYTTKRRAVF